MVSLLRSEGNDTADIEAKSAQGGLPENIANLLSAFANRPGGGTIILGLDENHGFAACGVYDVKAAQQGVVATARTALDPPVQVTTETDTIEGHQIIVVRVLEASPVSKPVRVKSSGQAYIRQYDGTYPLSDFEAQAFIASRSQPHYDREPVKEASMTDLDEMSVANFIRTRKTQSLVFSGWSDMDVLTHASVMTTKGAPTLAGLLSLGVFPQRFFPNLAIQASSWTGKARSSTSKVLDSAVIEGPIASMLDDAETWVARNTANAIVEGTGGNMYDEPQFPARAVRELVANALIHRDLGPYSRSKYVSLILEPGRLTITNPGGLFGVNVEALGHTDSSLRNGTLAAILMNVRSPSGERVIERLGSGIPAARDAMKRAELSPPQFFDTGISFTVRLFSTKQPGKTMNPGSAVPKNAATILALLRTAPSTAADLSQKSGLTIRQVRHALSSLISSGRATSNEAVRNVQYSAVAGMR